MDPLKRLSPHFKGQKREKTAQALAPTAGGNFGGFVRMSHELSVQRGSIENHRLEIERLAAARGIKITEWYLLPAVSGKSIWNHPIVVQMREDIKSGKIRGLVFTKLARLCRSLPELLQFRDFFVEQGAEMICPEFDTSTSSGKLIYNFLAVIAEFEREMIAERSKASVRPRAERGQNLGGKPKFGFRWVKKDVGGVTTWASEKNPAEVEVIRYILRSFLETQSYRTTAKAVSQAYKTRDGFEWSDSRIIEILTNPIYRGLWVRNRTTFKNGKVMEKDPSEWVVKESAFEPIFTREEADRIDRLIVRITQSITRPAVVQKYLLTQIKCDCGAKVYGRNERNGTRFYKCRDCKNKILAEEMDGIILGELENIHQNQDQIAGLTRQLQENIQARKALLAQAGLLRTERAGVEVRISRLLDVAMDVPGSSVKREIEKCQALMDSLDARTLDLEEQASAFVQIDDVKSFLDRVKSVPEIINRLPDGRAKFRVLSALIPSITLGQESIAYELNLLRDLPDFATNLRETADNRQGSTAASRKSSTLNFSKIRLHDNVFEPHLPLSTQLRHALKYLNLEQKEFAKLIGRDETTVNNWVAGRRLPGDSKTLKKVRSFIESARKKQAAQLAKIHGGSH